MDDALLTTVLSRLDADEALDAEAGLLVLAACQDELDTALRDEPVHRPDTVAIADAVEPAGAYLSSVTVEGFRGIGPEQTLELTPGPGFTLVVGRNGSGKSSFAEALELLLTGDSLRWQGRAAAWKQGWRNLHHSPTRVEAGLVVEGSAGTTRVRRTWDADDGLDAGSTVVQPVGQPKTDLRALGWTEPLATYRPFLSYNELGSLLEDGPSKLYDALESILGLDELNAAGELLRQARLERERAHKEVKQALTDLLPELAAADDPRAQACHDALAGKAWDLDRVAEILADRPGETVADLERLRSLAALEGPDPEAVEAAVATLRAAAEAWDAVAGTDAADADRLADLLERALAHHEQHGAGDCPVCGRAGALDEDWQGATASEVERLRAAAQQVRAARGRLTSAERDARALVGAPPPALSRADGVGLDLSEVREQWQHWKEGAERAGDPRALADHLEDQVLVLDEAVAQVRKAAGTELDRRQAAWQPLASRLAAWHGRARAAVAGMEQVPALKAAERWLKDTTGELRDERFAPIADECRAYWEQLRQHSNVELGGVQLTGSSTQRRVALDVTVDGVDGAAVSVMSQGELHALALSLFLPRATLPESPFRFLVIDDPVQSMDPTRVDGLARVLATVAEQRQVVVFTHDDRLAESVRRLDLPARVLEVTRRARSVVEVRQATDPVTRLLADARALASTDDLPVAVGRRVVPGFCRAATEAACAEAFRRRRLARGEPHLAVEDALTAATSLTQMAALALFDDAERAGDVLGALGRFGPRAAEIFKACDKGAHHGHGGDLHALINDAETIVKGLRRA